LFVLLALYSMLHFLKNLKAVMCKANCKQTGESVKPGTCKSACAVKAKGPAQQSKPVNFAKGKSSARDDDFSFPGTDTVEDIAEVFVRPVVSEPAPVAASSSGRSSSRGYSSSYSSDSYSSSYSSSSSDSCSSSDSGSSSSGGCD